MAKRHSARDTTASSWCGCLYRSGTVPYNARAMTPALQALYDARRTDRTGLAKRLADVDAIATGFATGQARAVLRAIGPRDADHRLTVYAGLFAEPYDFLRDPHVRTVSGFFGPIERMARTAGLPIEFLPADFHGLERLTYELRPRAIAAVVTPPDAEGFCSFGVHAAATAGPFLQAADDPARLAIAEVNAHMPWVDGLPDIGGNRVHLSQIDVLIEDATPLVAVPDVEPTAVERAIA